MESPAKPLPSPRFRVTLRALPQLASPERRLARLLKYALRQCGLKCESLEPAREKEESRAATG